MIKARYRVEQGPDTKLHRVPLLDEANTAVEDYIRQHAEMHGWYMNKPTAINEIIMHWARMMERMGAPILPDYRPGAHLDERPYQPGDLVNAGGRDGVFLQYLPADSALINFGDVKMTMQLHEIEKR